MKSLATPAEWSPRSAGLCFVIGLALALLVGLAGLHQQPLVRALDRTLLDALQRRTASGAQALDTVVVDIDEVSLSAVGQWPWPRYRLAALIEAIAAQRPAAIAMDILLPEADRASLTDIQQTFKRDFDLDVSFAGVPDGLLDNDGYLGEQMARADVVGARYFYFDHLTDADRPLRPGIGFDGALDRLTLDRAPGVLDNVQTIASQTRVSGFVNMQTDEDGVLRRLPLLIEHQGVVHGSLALAATMRALKVASGHVEVGRDGLSLRIGPHAIPIDRRGAAVLHFNGAARRYDSLPAVEVLAGRVKPADLRGKIVLIGSSAVGLNDLHATPMERSFSGAKIQSVLVQNILDDAVVRIPSWGGAAALVASLLLAAGLCGLFVRSHGLLWLSMYVACAAGLLLALDCAVFLRGGLFLPVAAPLLVLGGLLALCFAARLVVHQRRAQRWRKQLENARQVTIESMSAVAETRDPETGAHIKRTQHYVRAIAQRLQQTGHYVETLSEDYIHLLFLSAPLHDIGKVGVPDHILLKPGPLTPEEWVTMRKHAEFGRQIILSTAQRIEGDNFLTIASEIAATHHEKWDGSGYPNGLKGQAIPLSGRIMAAADIYDALISRRCYKEPFPHAQAMAMMRELDGITFDPAVLEAFLAIEDQILHIAASFRDEDEEPAIVQMPDLLERVR
jgi:adenylate cyclase